MQSQLQNYYTQNGFRIAIDIYYNPRNYNSVLISLSFRYLLTFLDKYNYTKPTRDEIHETIKNIYFNNVPNNIYKLEVYHDLLDIIIHYLPNQTERALERIVNLDNETEIFVNKNNKTLYDDSQNVHNNSINKSVINAASYLFKKYYYNIDIEKMYNDIKKDIIHTQSLDMIKQDPTRYNNLFTLQDILISLWNFIEEKEEKEKEELFKRLKEELIEMDNKCSTGRLARLINVLQGFTSDSKLEIVISDITQYTNIVYNYLNNKLKNCDDENIINGIIDKNNQYIQFIKKNIEEKLIEWRNEYKIDKKTVYIIVNKYAEFDIYVTNYEY